MKTTRINHIATAFFLCLSLVGCSKDYLEVEPPTAVTNSQLAKLPKDISTDISNGIFNGMYALLYRPGSGGGRGDQDFGQRSTDLMTDILTGDFVKTSNAYRHFSGNQKYRVTTNPLDNGNYQLWFYYYHLIYAANDIIEKYPQEDAQLSTEARVKKGQALAMRGFAYFYLTQLFAPEYKPDEVLCPIYTNIQQENQSISTQEQVYQQTISDFNKAIELLKDFNRPNKTLFDSSVASAYLAMTYAAMGNYTEVEKLTKALIDLLEYKPFAVKDILFDEKTQLGGGFNNLSVSGAMWGSKIVSGTGNQLYSWWGQCDPFMYGYASLGEAKCINDELYASIREDDVRKKQFVDWSVSQTYLSGSGETLPNPFYGNTSFVNLPTNKFYSPGRKLKLSQNINWDYIYLRIDEMYLLNAEAKAFLNKDDEAKTILKSYLSERIGDLSYIDALDNGALKQEIYKQWRIEFLGEGKSYLAMKRFKATISTGTNRYDTINRSKRIKYNDTKMYYKIPDLERQNNTNLGLPSGY